jgi:hypothetical protein
MSSMVTEISDQIAAQTEKTILDQLGVLVSEGLLVLEKGPQRIVQEANHNGFKLMQDIRLVLKDKEYLAKLEAENAKLKSQIATLKEAAAVICGIEQ